MSSATRSSAFHKSLDQARSSSAAAATGVPEENYRGASSNGTIDPPIRRGQRWEFRYYSAPWGGALATAGGSFAIAGDMEGYVIAFDAATGKVDVAQRRQAVQSRHRR